MEAICYPDFSPLLRSVQQRLRREFTQEDVRHALEVACAYHRYAIGLIERDELDGWYVEKADLLDGRQRTAGSLRTKSEANIAHRVHHAAMCCVESAILRRR